MILSDYFRLFNRQIKFHSLSSLDAPWRPSLPPHPSMMSSGPQWRPPMNNNQPLFPIPTVRGLFVFQRDDLYFVGHRTIVRRSKFLATWQYRSTDNTISCASSCSTTISSIIASSTTSVFFSCISTFTCR